jgi:hypothetical protein
LHAFLHPAAGRQAHHPGTADPAHDVHGDPVAGLCLWQGAGQRYGGGLVGAGGGGKVRRRPQPDDAGTEQRRQDEHGDRGPLAAGAGKQARQPVAPVSGRTNGGRSDIALVRRRGGGARP